MTQISPLTLTADQWERSIQPRIAGHIAKIAAAHAEARGIDLPDGVFSAIALAHDTANDLWRRIDAATDSALRGDEAVTISHPGLSVLFELLPSLSPHGLAPDAQEGRVAYLAALHRTVVSWVKENGRDVIAGRVVQ